MGLPLKTTGEVDLPPPVVQRLICHALIQHLHRDGLAEAVQALQDMVAFYAEQRPALPAPTRTVTVPVTVSRSYTEPVYPVTED